VPSTSTKEEVLYPHRNPEKQPSTKQLTITLINQQDTGSSSSDLSNHTDTDKSNIVSGNDQGSSEDFTDISLSFDDEQVDIIEILMADQVETSDPHVSKYESETKQPQMQTKQLDSSQTNTTSNGPFFTLDDIPLSKRIERLNQFRAWINTQLTKGVSLRQTLVEFCSRFTGSVNDWYTMMGEYR
jgi:hypothetical protein